MPEDTPSPRPVPPSALARSESGTPFHIGEEFGTAKKNLPSLKIVGIAVAVIAVIAALFSFVQRPDSATTGSIDDVVPDQNLAADTA
jgi:hypothetical protein